MTIERNDILAVIPTYNNEKTLARVIGDVRRYCTDVLVVNDGSTDSTAGIIAGAGVGSISYAPNRGKGYALRRALRYAAEHGYRYMLTIDSDGQHYASDIPKFVEEIAKTPDALLVGARNLRSDNMPGKNTFANKFSNFWFRVETGIRLDDTQSGFRLYPVRRMKGMRFATRRYEFEVEVLVRAAWRGIEVRNIPVRVFYPEKAERVSHFRPGKDFTRISILNTLLVLGALLFYYPWRFLRSLTRENIRRFVVDNITRSKDSNPRLAASIGLGGRVSVSRLRPPHTGSPGEKVGGRTYPSEDGRGGLHAAARCSGKAGSARRTRFRRADHARDRARRAGADGDRAGAGHTVAHRGRGARHLHRLRGRGENRLAHRQARRARAREFRPLQGKS